MQFDSRYQRLSETRGRWPGRETNGQALDGTKRQREHRLELLLFLLVLLFLRDLVQLEAELAFAHALALPAPGAAVAWVKAVRIDNADDDDDNDDNDDDDDDGEYCNQRHAQCFRGTLLTTASWNVMANASGRALQMRIAFQ